MFILQNEESVPTKYIETVEIRPLLSCLNQLQFMILLFVVVVSGGGCEVSAPFIQEVVVPTSSSDQIGPYRVRVRVGGQVDLVMIYGQVQTPNQNQSEPFAIMTRLEGEMWWGEIEGQFDQANYEFWIEAQGPGGATRYPSESNLSFQIRRALPCTNDTQCPPQNICSRQTQTCIPKPSQCASDFDCPQDQFCNSATQECRFRDAQCTRDDECDLNQRCEDRRCIDECNGACPDGFLCIADVCERPQCQSADDCPEALPLCEEQICVAPPLVCEPECGLNEICIEGQCTPRPSCEELPCPEGSWCWDEACVECLTDAQCGEGRSCDLQIHQCVEGLRGQPCVPCGLFEEEWGSECGVGFVCVDGVSGCRKACQSEEDCGGLECYNGGCMGPYGDETCLGLECQSGQDCESLVCESGYCAPPQYCERDEECGVDLRCSRFLCVPRNECDHTEPFSCEDSEICFNQRCQEIDQSPSCNECEEDTDCPAWQWCADFELLGQKKCYGACSQTCLEGEVCVSWGEFSSTCIPDPNFSCFEPDGECGFDSLEPNQAPGEATVLFGDQDQPLGVDGWLCAQDEDWLRLPEDLIWGEVEIQAELGMEVGLWKEGLDLVQIVRIEDGFNNTLRLSLDEIQWISFRTEEEDNFAYSLLFYPSGPQVPECDQDRLEPNESPQDAYPIGNGASLAPTLCLDEQDWFTFNVESGDQVGIVLDFFFTGDETLALWWGVGDQLNRIEVVEPFFIIEEVIGDLEGREELFYLGFQLIQCTFCSSVYYAVNVEID